MREKLGKLNPELRTLRALQAPQHVQFDPATQQFEVSSAAFKMQSDGTISVDLEEVLIADGHELDHGYPRVARPVGLIAHKVGRLEQAGLKVSHDPLEINDYHGIAAGSASRSERRALAASCEIVRPLDQTMAMRQKEEAEKLAADAKAARLA